MSLRKNENSAIQIKVLRGKKDKCKNNNNK